LAGLADVGIKVIDFLQQNSTAATAAKVAIVVLGAAVVVATGAWVAMNLAFIATPIGALITGLVLLAGALVVAYKRSQTFRDIVTVGFYAVKLAVIGMALQAAIAFQGLLKVALFAMGAIIHNAAVMFGWLPFGIGQKLKDADAKFTNFKNSANATMAKVRTHLEISLATSKAEYAASRLKYKLDQIRSKSITIAVSGRLTGRVWDGTRWINAGQFASGTPSAPRGWAWVGEQGPELMKLKGGERIIPASESAAIASAKSAASMTGVAAGGTTVVINVNGPSIGIPSTIAQQIQQALLQLQRESGIKALA
jgi:hypothetical protein